MLSKSYQVPSPNSSARWYIPTLLYTILFTTGDIRVECIVRLSSSISRIVLPSNGPADLSATQIERARNSIGPGSRESGVLFSFRNRYLLAAGNGNYRQNTRRLRDIHFGCSTIIYTGSVYARPACREFCDSTLHRQCAIFIVGR